MRIPVVSLALVAGAGLSVIAIASSSQLRAKDDGRRAVQADGIVKVKSAYPMAETISRLKADVAAKGIVFFQAIDQQKLASDAGISLPPSTLLIFGNPALGSLFITARPEAGLDWPVRLLVHEDASGQVWTAYSDFAWIARRHGITNRRDEFAMATKVIGSITSSVTAK